MQANLDSVKVFTVRYFNAACAITEPDVAPALSAALSDAVTPGTLAADATLLAATTLTQEAAGIYRIAIDLAASGLVAGDNFRIDLTQVDVAGGPAKPATVSGQVDVTAPAPAKPSVEVSG